LVKEKSTVLLAVDIHPFGLVMVAESTPTSTTAASRTEAAAASNHEISCDAIAEARELAEMIHRSADILLERLLSHLSQLPELPATEEEDLEEESREGNRDPLGNDKTDNEEAMMLKRGLTVPVSAVAWLSGQLDALDRQQQKIRQQQQQQNPGLASALALALALASADETTTDDDDKEEEGKTKTGSSINCNNVDSIEPWLGTEEATSLRYRLNLLRFLLPRAQLIRLTRQPWPPRSSSSSRNGRPSFLCSASSSKQRLKQWWKKRQRQQPWSSSRQDNSNDHNSNDDYNDDNDNDNDNDATEAPSEIEIAASEFLRYSRRFKHGASKCVNLWRVFPNATVLILDSVPPSWIDIDTKGRGGGGLAGPTASKSISISTPSQKQPAALLRLISVNNAAIYDLKDFLPPLSILPSSTSIISTAVPVSLLQSQLLSNSYSLTHLKLENCSLGELTKGFASSLAQLVHLEYLSLRHNQFRSAKTLLKGLRPLIRLRYLDVSANQLVGCFGPYANLCLGGQVKTLKLSDNLLETCRNSGLEKCYALCELWLDSNHIQDVAEVSCLARLPDLQCLALQRNPFSTRTKAKSNAHPSPLPSSVTHNNRETNPNVSSSGKDNPFYDPNWKIRLWTWFQHERRALTPLELPVFNKKTKHMGIHHNDCDAATIGRMTREEWDRIQEESYSIAATVSTTVTTTSSLVHTPPGRTGAPPVAEEGLPRMEESSQTTATTIPVALKTPTTADALALRSPLLLAPVRNRKVTKKHKTRQAKIRTTNDNKSSRSNDDDDDVAADSVNKTRNQKTTRGRRRKQRNGKKSSSELLSKGNSPAIQNDASGNGNGNGKGKGNGNGKESSSLKATKDSSIVYLTDGDEHNSEKNMYQLSFSLQDVLISLQHEHLQKPQPPNNTESETLADSLDDEEIIEIEKDTNQNKESLSSKESSSGKNAADDDAPNNPFLEDDVSQDEVAPKNSDAKEEEGDNSDVQNYQEDAKILEAEGNTKESRSSEPTPLEAEQDRSDNAHVPKEEQEKSDESGGIQQSNTTESNTTDEASNTESSKSRSRSSPKRSPRRSPRKPPHRPAAIDEDRIFVKPKVASIKLNRMGNYKPFDALNSDWDDLVKKASEGRIPDGLLKSPVGQSSNDFTMNADVFSDNAVNLLLGNTNNEKASANSAVAKVIDQASASRSTSDPTLDQSVSSNDRLASTLPEHVWPDDNSVLSSLGASRDDILPGGANKFQLAEENCSYDGPDSSRGMKVVENLQLYFETFVFNTSMPDIPADVLEEMEEDQDDWQLITMHYPRIQLWPDDRRLLELERVRISSSSMNNSADWTTNRERFLRVWGEDVVPCGKPALRRLPPNRRNRLGFHGDKLFENADVDGYAECRKVLLCLSSKAFYVIPEKDNVTMDHQQQAKKRRFPLPLDRGDRFRDAPWPHAVARHCLGELEAICIGFEFQRLTLRFRNHSLPGSDPFVYVLLTGDKRASVRIFQEIQKLAKDLGDNNGISNLGNGKNSSTIEIENDSHIVLDSLNNLIDHTDSTGHQEQTIGTILHFQIVQQQWRHGDRGTVRRVCVITDTKILLLDEDYTADGHDLSSVTVKGKHMADVRYRLVDQAAISLVSQVQAAGTDPRAITIIIQPSALSRTHRWRLVCRDREGAERLVEDARKVLENI
jgi:hypothetical protein